MVHNYRHPNFVTVKPGAQKIIFYNAHHLNSIEFTDNRANLGMDILHKGISVLCLCNPHWKINIGNHEMYISLKPTKDNLQNYYIRKIECTNTKFEYFRIEHVDHNLSSNYACTSQIRSLIGCNNNLLQINDFPKYVPIALRPNMESVYSMKTAFYNCHNRYYSCVLKNPPFLHFC